MTAEERALLVEQAVSAFRERDPHGELRPHPAWHDLDEEGRLAVYRATLVQRTIEAALDRDGRSTTARLVLSRIRG